MCKNNDTLIYLLCIFRNRAARSIMINRHVTPRGSGMKEGKLFYDRSEYWEISAAGGIMSNRHVTPKGPGMKEGKLF